MEYSEMVDEHERDKKRQEQAPLAPCPCYPALVERWENYHRNLTDALKSAVASGDYASAIELRAKANLLAANINDLIFAMQDNAQDKR